MLNKDKRSLLLMFILGDGCLHPTSNKRSGSITVDHGIAQADYQAWKVKLVSDITGRNINLRQGHKGKSVQFSVTFKRFKAWYKFCYPNRKKDLAKVIKFIRHPEMALAVWLMDDGYVEPSLDKRYPDQLYGASLRLFTCDQSEATQNVLIQWFTDNFQVTPKVLYSKKGNTKYPFLKFNQVDSLKIWKVMREFTLQFKSMQHKFRYIEQIYQSRCSQPQAVEKLKT